MCLLSGGCPVLQQCVHECISEILSSCISGLQASQSEGSLFHSSCRVYVEYGILIMFDFTGIQPTYYIAVIFSESKGQ